MRLHFFSGAARCRNFPAGMALPTLNRRALRFEYQGQGAELADKSLLQDR
jgi:hypothetical protein